MPRTLENVGSDSRVSRTFRGLGLGTSLILLLCGVVFLGGCGKKEAEGVAATATPPKPKEAATQLDQAFSSADQELKVVAGAASTALQTADYEAAVQSLSIMKEQGSLTMDQGIAVYNSMVSLETRLLNAMAAGDQNAKRAYEQLKKSRRN